MSLIPDLVAVIGGGRMGAGVAQVFAVAGADVTVVEVSPSAAEQAHQRIADGLRRGASRDAFDEDPARIIQRIHFTGSFDDVPSDTGLVIEAVVEKVGEKIAVLTAAERVVAPTCVIASNTSSLSISEMACALVEPARFVGMHFFNPVPASALVEVVRGQQTSAAVIESVVQWSHTLGKSEVVVNDSPGFATSRLGVALGLEAIRMVESGVADAESIDRAMELGYRHPSGPLRSTDLVGLDVRLAIAEHLHATLGERFEPPALLRDMVARGELGRKCGQGFYTWPASTPRR